MSYAPRKVSAATRRAWQAQAWERALIVRAAQLTGQPLPYGSKMVPGSKATKPARKPGKPAKPG